MKDDKQIIVRQFDPETGAIDERLLASLTEQQVTEIMEDGHAVFLMSQSKGWKLINESLSTIIEQLKEKLVDVNDFEEIKRHQAIIRAYSNVLGLVKQHIVAGEQLAQLRDPAGD